MKRENIQKLLSFMSLSYEEREVALRELKPLPSELYVRKSLDREWVENLKDLILQGFYEPVLIVASSVEALGKNYLVDTHHTYQALKELGRTSAPALVISKPIDLLTLYELQLQLNKAEQKPVSLREKKESLLRLYIKLKNMHGYKFWENRRALLEKLSSATEIPIRTIYAYLEEQLKEEKKQLQEIALRLYQEGKTQQEIEEMLGVPRRTLSDWIKNLSEGDSHFGEKCSAAQIAKTLVHYTQVFRDRQSKTLSDEFLLLLGSALEEGTRSYEFFREKAERFEREELEEFKRYLNTLLEEMALSAEKLSPESFRKSAFVKLVREKLSLSEKAGQVLYEESKGLFEVVKKAREELKRLVEELCEHDEAVSEERLKELVKQRLEEKRRSGRFGEGSEYAMLAGFIIKHFSKLYAELEERAQECLKKRPVLTEEEVFSHYTEEELMELKEEELREELRASFPQYKIPESVLRKVLHRLQLAREQKIKSLLLERAKDPKTKDLQEIATTQEEREVLRKYLAEVQDAFNSLKTATEKTAFKLNPESKEDLEKKLLQNGYRTFNVQELYTKVERVRELLREFENSYYTYLSEFEGRLKGEDRVIITVFNDAFVNVLNNKEKAGKEDHRRWAKRALEEGLSVEEVRKKAWEEEKLLLIPSSVVGMMAELAQAQAREAKTQAEKPQEEQTNQQVAKGIGTKGLLRLIAGLRKRMQELKMHAEKGDLKEVIKIAQELEERLQKAEEQLQAKMQTQEKKKLKHDNNKLYDLLALIDDFSRKHFDLPVVFSGEEGNYLKLLDKAVSRYEEVLKQKGIDRTLEQNYSEIAKAFLETYAYARLKAKYSLTRFLSDFINFRQEFGGDVRRRGYFISTNKEKKSYEEIVNLVKRYLDHLAGGKA
ncbi:MAG: helix-turn-helix domain-containing protein [Nitrososphaerales archaeon]